MATLMPDQKYPGGYIPPRASSYIIVVKFNGVDHVALWSSSSMSGSGQPVYYDSFVEVPVDYNSDTQAYVKVNVPVPKGTSWRADTYSNNSVENNTKYKDIVVPDINKIVRQEYVNVIKELLGADVPSNHEGNITPEVIALVNQALNEVQKGSQGMLAADLGFNLFYSATAWSDFITTIGFNAITEPKTKTVSGWLNVLNGVASYQSVRNAVVVKYKSAVSAELIR